MGGLGRIKNSNAEPLKSEFSWLEIQKQEFWEMAWRKILRPTYDFLVRNMLKFDKNEGEFQGGPYFENRTPNSYGTPPP